MTCSIVLLTWLALLPVGQAREKEDLPPHVDSAMRELWRRGTCLLSSVDKPAAKEAPVPKDVGATPVLTPRLLARNGKLLCYAVDGNTIWAADEQNLYQVDAAAGRLVGQYGRAEGLPDEAIQSIAPAGRDVWLATRGGLARLNCRTGKIAAVPEVRFTLGRLAGGAGGVWLVSDAGAYRLAPGQRQWQKLPDFPALAELAQIARRGFWSAWWRRRTLAVIPSMFATDDGLYVVVLNALMRYDPGTGTGGGWTRLSGQTWQALPQGRTVWALTSGGVIRYRPDGPATGERFAPGRGPAAGRPVAMAAAESAFLLASEPDYDPKAERFTGGGVSRFDLASGKWTVTDTVDGEEVRFVSAVLADGAEAWAACTLYDQAIELGAHPGMAHVKRWRPRCVGLGLLHRRDGRWTLIKHLDLKTDKRWVMGQRGTVATDGVGPDSVERLCRCGGRLWGIYRMVPERYYAGYYISAGALAERQDGRWGGRPDCRTEELALAGEYPEVMLISRSHGHRIVLAEGHPVVLGIEQVAGRAWAVCQSGLFVHDPQADRFVPVVREGCRVYWRATAAAAGADGVWFGGDGGTVSRLDRASGRLELVGVVPGRKVVSIAAKAGRVAVRTAKAPVPLPVLLRSASKLPDADELVFDGGKWSAKAGGIAPRKSPFTCRSKGSFLYRGRERVAFLKGVFRPVVLCEDRAGGKLWLSTYSGLASIPLPADASK